MKRLLLIALLSAPLALSANEALKDCSTKAKMTTATADLKAKAKISEADAKKAALTGAGKDATIQSGGLGTEDGCLVYNYHVRTPGEKNLTEVLVDAGNGKVLLRDKEGAIRTALDKPMDKTKELTEKARDKVSGSSSK